MRLLPVSATRTLPLASIEIALGALNWPLPAPGAPQPAKKPYCCVAVAETTPDKASPAMIAADSKADATTTRPLTPTTPIRQIAKSRRTDRIGAPLP